MVDTQRGASRSARGATPMSRTKKPDSARAEQARRKRPAVQKKSRPRSSERLGGALHHHRQMVVQSLKRLIASPAASLMTCLVMAVALVLPSVMLVAVDNIKQLSAGWDGSPQLTLYLRGTARPASLMQKLANDSRIESLVYLSADQALAEFEQYSGLADVTAQLEHNPLPAVLVLRPHLAALQGEQAQALLTEMQALSEVELASLDLEWIERLRQILQLSERSSWLLALLLAIAVLLVIGNTIRLAIENRRSEIVVIKLVGGSDAYVRRPFLYTGLWYGAGAGMMAACLVQILVWLVQGPAARLATLYQSQFELQGLGLAASIGLILVGALLGWSGAWLASVRHLREIEPR
ncbi:permease-like cell division protein FtsX [Aestuariirhabdus sp. Z084]|uniref:permease-like cell division protein FtsX n=1 Tax=Aestuariirhabdus haliotis TaxID=2918751 RepID=UPI00201B3F10|nr:permease-like cell division protein FtsX [Aestuariirhabdus haliotis]MCL6414169.1 permease-like cell division protein FtsX [Aestuariirhabdus haliotis]MCL6418101.1 permease-like cell division protein FtsX [Aestuariirhabdus haliotis]